MEVFEMTVRFNTSHLERCIATLESSLSHLSTEEEVSIRYEVFRNAVIRSFELTLEIANKLLRKGLKAYGGSLKEIDVAEPFQAEMLLHHVVLFTPQQLTQAAS